MLSPFPPDLQEPIYQPNHYLSLMEFREQTLQRLKKFTEQRFFSSRDYLRGDQGGLCFSRSASTPRPHVCRGLGRAAPPLSSDPWTG